ncbi:MAG: hypothetical protein RSD08_09780 [Oscillospiraceae bacterium]
MAFQRIAQTEIDAADNLGRDDTPNAGTAGMQQILDAYPNLIAKKFNLLVDSLDTEISSRYTKAETDAKIGAKVVEIGAGDMAKAVYDTNGDGVVNDSDNGIFVYTHTKSGKVHNFVFGSGLSSPANGKALMTAALSAGDTVQINGVAYPAFAGVDSVEELPAGRWVTFVFDGAQVNFKSGGAALNFKVFGGTAAPVNPQENTLWVNTDKPIAGWSFLCTQYTGTSPDGWVQVICGVTSNVSFNALKKSELIVYPTACLQYDGNVWSTKSAKIYQGGVWKDFRLWLYNNGIKYAAVTGDWQTKTSGAYSSVTFGAKSVVIRAGSPSGAASGHAAICTGKKVDVSDISYLKFKIKSYSLNGAAAYQRLVMYIANEFIYYPEQAGAAASVSSNCFGNAETTFSIDCASLRGSYFIGITTQGYADYTTLEGVEIWGE